MILAGKNFSNSGEGGGFVERGGGGGREFQNFFLRSS